MRVRHFTDTNVLWNGLRRSPTVETRDADQETLVEVNAAGNVGAFAIGHASRRADRSSFHFERVTA
jgi:uncharacterized protein YuzE